MTLFCKASRARAVKDSAVNSVVKVIVNADDFGFSRAVNEAILALLADGRLRSTSIIANGREIGAADRIASRFPGCSFGAHLNLTEFAPLSRATRSVLVGNSGEMSKEHLQRLPATPRLWQAVYEECGAQIQHLLRLGIPVSHIDSHRHAHTIPALFPALKAVQRRFGIRRIRPSRNLYKKAEQAGRVLLAKKSAFNFCLRSIYRSNTPDGFTDLETLIEAGEAGARFKTVEVMVHPGARGHDKETSRLRDSWSESLPYTTNLISYWEL